MDPSSEYEQSSFLDELPAPESRESRRVVLNTLSSACEVLGQEAHDSGSEELQNLFNLVNDARGETVDRNQNTRTIEFEVDGLGTVSQQEGVPVDGLVDYLREKARSSPQNSAERSKYYRYARILHKNSMPYSSFSYTERDHMNFAGRVMHEANLMSQDGRGSENEHENIRAAAEVILARRELMIPSENAKTFRGSSQKTTEDAPTPEDAETLATLPDPEESADDETPGSEEAGENEDVGEGDEISPEEPETPPPAPPTETESENDDEPPEPETAPPEESDSEGEELGETTDRGHEEEAEDEHTTVSRDEIRRIRVDIFNAQALVEKTVREWADEQGRKEMFALEGGKGLRSKLKSYLNPVRMFRGLKLHTAEEWYRQRRVEVAMSALRDSGKLMIENLDAEEIGHALADFDIQQSEVQALAQQLDAAVLQGQEVRELDDDSELKQLMTNEIFEPVVNGEISDHAALQHRLREFVSAHANNADVQALFGEGAQNQLAKMSEFYATNLLEQADAIRENLDAHGFAIDSLDKVIDIRLADIDWLAESEARFTKADRTIAWLQKGRFRSALAHPAAIGAAFSLGTHGALKIAGVGGRVASLTVPVVGALSGATFAGLRRSYELKKDRSLHQTDMAYQRGDVEEGGRRAGLEEFSLKMSSVQELLDGSDRGDEYPSPFNVPEGIRQLLKEDLEGLEGAVNRQRLLQKMAEVTERLDYSDKNNVDLVSYEGRMRVNQGRCDLVRSYVDAERALLAAGMGEDEIAVQSTEYRTQWESYFLQDQEDQERAFRRYRVRNSAKAALVGGATGLAGAFASQQVLAVAKSVMPGVPGASLVGSLLGRGKDGIEQGLTTTKQKAPDVPGRGVAGSVFEQGKKEVGRGLSASGRVASRAPGAPLVGSVFERGKSAFEKVPSVNNIPGVRGERIRERTKEVVTGTRTIQPGPVEGPPVPGSELHIDSFKQLYSEGGSLPVGDEYRLVAGDSHSVFLENVASGDRFEDFSLEVTKEGKISGVGELPPTLQEQFEELGFEVSETIEKTTEPYTVFEPNTPMYEASIRPDGSGPIVKIPEGTVWIEGKDGASTLIVADRPDIVLMPDVKINDEGVLTYDTEYSYGKHLQERIAAGERDLIGKEDYDLRIGERKNGLFEQLEIAYDETEGATSVEIKDVFGEEGVWRENATHIDERQWYSYDAEGSQSNELQLYTYKDGDAVTLDMSTMGTAHQQGLEPNPIHVQDLVGNRNEKIGFTFVLPTDQKNPIFVVDGADGSWDGKLRLDPNADPSLRINPDDPNSMRLRDFSKLVINQEALQKLDDGNIATELTGNEEVFAVCHGSPGFVEAGRMAHQDGEDVFQAFATIRGETEIADKVEITTVIEGKRVAEVNFNAPLIENIPGEKHVFSLTPPDAPEVIEAEPITVPVTETVTEKIIEEPPPMIPFPFVPRYPLEPLIIPKPKYPYYRWGVELFRRPDGAHRDMAEIIRFRNSQAARNLPTSHYLPPRERGVDHVDDSSVSEDEGRREGERALRVVRETYDNAPRVYFVLSGAIGDSVIDSAYIEGVRQDLEQRGLEKEISIIAPQHILDLLKPTSDQYGYELIPGERYNGESEVRQLIEDRDDEGVLVLEFDHHDGRPVVGELPKNGVIVSDLFAASVALHDQDRSGNNRFGNFFKEFLSVPQSQNLTVSPYVALPSDHQETFERLASKYDIDTGYKQVSIVIEASHKMKKYAYKNWIEVINQLREAQSNLQVNVVVGPASSMQEVENVFGELPNTSIVSESLSDITSFLAHQDLVVSNDTGLAHLSAVVEDGPQVISLHATPFPPQVWITDTTRHLGILTPFDQEFNSETDNEDEKAINHIPPEEVVSASLRLLSGEKIPKSGEQPTAGSTTTATTFPSAQRAIEDNEGKVGDYKEGGETESLVEGGDLAEEQNERSVAPEQEAVESRVESSFSPEVVAAAVEEIFERAGKRSAEELMELAEKVKTIHIEEKRVGAGKLAKTITEMREKQKNAGVKEVVNDHGVVYLPEEEGDVVVVGDIHGDFATVEQIVQKEEFLEDMESGNPTKTLVFLGDYVDRGNKSIEVMEALLALKKRYPQHVVLLKADHEAPPRSVSSQDFPDKAVEHYSDERIKPSYFYDEVFSHMPHMAVCGNEAVLIHGGPPGTHGLREISENIDQLYPSMEWADPVMGRATEGGNRRRERLLQNLERRIARIQSVEENSTRQDQLEKYEYAKKMVEDGYYPNTRRVGGDEFRAIEYGFYTYSRTALQKFLDKIGGKVLIRGHEETEPNNQLDDGGLWTIHSTGAGSPDSYYSHRELRPQYAVFDKNVIVDSVNSSQHIRSVW